MMLVNDKINGTSPGHPPAPGPARRSVPLPRGAGILPATLRPAAHNDNRQPPPPISNRDWKLLETPVTHTKQTTDSFLIETKLHPFPSPQLHRSRKGRTPTCRPQLT